MATTDAITQVTEHALDVVTRTLSPEETQVFLDHLLQHQVIDYVTWRKYRFAGWSIEDVLRETRKTGGEAT